MKLRTIKCDQFAGIRDRQIKFSDGLNILFGENESGKSTLADLIYQILFKDSRIDGRSDAEFIDNYFPKKVEGKVGDVIDGILRFETKEGIYRLEKEWENKGGTVKLITPEGDRIKSKDEIETILKRELGYGSRVYSEVIFPSKKRQNDVTKVILGDDSKMKQKAHGELKDEILGSLTKAVLETGGISIDKLEKAINEKIFQYSENWDFDTDGPRGGIKRGINNKWISAKTKLADEGKQSNILRAYYDLKDCEKKQESAKTAQERVDEVKQKITKASLNLEKISGKRENFLEYRVLLERLSQEKKTLEILSLQQEESEKAYKVWPALLPSIDIAKELKRKEELAKVRDLFYKAKKIIEECKNSENMLGMMHKVDKGDIKEIHEANNSLVCTKGRLSGLDIVAKISKLGDVPMEIKSVATEKKLDIKEDMVKIKEAVTLEIPEIIKMQIMPQGLDIEEVKDEIKINNNKIKTIYNKYGVSSIQELLIKNEKYEEIEGEIRIKKAEISGLLRDISWEELQKENEKVPLGLETTADIQEAILKLCDGNLDYYISSKETLKKSYEDKYESIEKLENLLDKTTKEIKKSEEFLLKVKDIPKEYKSIEDPEAYDKILLKRIKEAQENLDLQREELKEAEKELGEQSFEEYSEEIDELKSKLNESKAACEHYKNIQRVFYELKNELENNPMEDIEINFRKYLAFISGERIKLSKIDTDLTASIVSGKNALSYPILSEGTKDTISLAFRLALLEHLFPEGEGIAVFDDPFTDMDPVRVKQSCALIQEFAKKNQVIFITCDEKYKELLDGKEIDWR